MRCASAVASDESNRHNSTLVACSEKSAKLTPFPSHVAPNGKGRPGHTLMHGSPRVGFDSLCRSGRPRVVLRIVSQTPRTIKLDDHLKKIITYNLTMTIPRFARRAATSHPHQLKPDPRGEDGKYVGSKRRPRKRRMSFKVRAHSSLTRRPVSSNVQKTSFSMGASQAAASRSASSAVGARGRTGRASLPPNPAPLVTKVTIIAFSAIQSIPAAGGEKGGSSPRDRGFGRLGARELKGDITDIESLRGDGASRTCT